MFAWEQCKLGDVGTFKGGFGFPENEQGNDSGIPFYKVSDMNDRYNALMMKRASNYVSDSQIDINNWKPILGQNIIFAKVGAAVYLERKRKVVGPFLLDNNMMSFQPKNADIDYIYYIFQRLHISKHAQVGTLPSLNAGELRNIEINIPSLAEQRVVANIGVKIDQTITLHEEKKRQLERLKSALLQKMFADKSGYPDIRFEGFSDEWEQCKLGDVCEPITDSIDTQKYPNEVFAEYSMPAFDASMKPYIVLGSSMNSVRKIITRPCLLVNKLNVRKKRIWYVKKPNKNAVCSAEFIPLRSDTVDLTFLNQVAKSETFTRYLENHSSGSSNSQKRITPRSLMLSKLHIPTIEEQKLIGKIFEYLDHTITLHDQKLNLLKLVKQSLLQNMFI
ncbi:restriction endonuclease subunit S [Lactobacillus delbrueckii subsp. bulgaricus]